MKKFLKVFVVIIISVLVIVLGFVLITFPPVMTGMGAKTMCSCVFVTHRTPESVLEKELRVFPGLTWADIALNQKDSSVTASLLWNTSKAIYRKGLGCTLLYEKSEQAVRGQKINRPDVIPAVNQDTIPWPQGNKLDTSKLGGINYTALEKAIDEAFVDIDPLNPIHTHAVVVVYKGELIAERYAAGFNYNSRLMGWSMTKSIANALVGILAKENKLDVDDPAPVQEWQNDDRKKITINHLLNGTSGLAWSESYFNPVAPFHQMFIRSDDKAAYAASLGLEEHPGTFFEYSSANTNLLSRIIRHEVGDENYYRFPYEKLFHKIGMNHAIIEPDASGTFVLSSYFYASARDWARFGLLYLNDGVWNGERILPEGWVTYSTTPAPPAPKQEYGAQIWLNYGSKNNPEEKEFPGLPNEAFLFEGFERNSVVIIPSKELVVVRLGVTHNKNFNHGNLINGVIAALPQ